MRTVYSILTCLLEITIPVTFSKLLYKVDFIIITLIVYSSDDKTLYTYYRNFIITDNNYSFFYNLINTSSTVLIHDCVVLFII